jgi:hypothetical protein
MNPSFLAKVSYTCWYLLTHIEKDLQAYGYRWVFYPGDISRVSYLFIRKEKVCDD